MKGLIFTYLLTYGGAALALVSPYAGLLAYICISLIKPHSLWFWSVSPGNYSRTVGIALIIGWVLNGCGSWKVGRGRAIVGLLVAYWVWSVVCAFFAEDPEAAWQWVEYLAKIVVPFLIGVTLLDSVWKLKVMAWMIVISHGYLAFEFNLSYFSGHNRLWSEGFGGMDNNCMVIALVCSLGMALVLFFQTPSWWLKGVALLSMAFMGHAVLFSFSRGGMLATGVIGGVAFLILPKTTRHYAFFGLCAAAAIYLAGPQVRDRLLSSLGSGAERDSSAQSRLNLWRDCTDCFLKNPILGVGPRSWPKVAEERYGWIGQVKEAHTLWLQTAAQLGLPGFLILTSFYLLTMWRLWPLARSAPVPDPWLRDGARMIIVALTGFVFAAQFVSIEPLELPFFINLLGVGILRVASTTVAAESSSDSPLDPEAAPADASPLPPQPLWFPERRRRDPTVRFRSRWEVDLGAVPQETTPKEDGP